MEIKPFIRPPRRGTLSSIVSRLRFVFAAVTIIIAIAVVAGIFQTRAVRSAHDRLVGAEVPVLVQTHETVRDLQLVFNAIERAAIASGASSLAETRGDYEFYIASLQTDLDTLTAVDTTGSITARANDTLTRLRNEAANLFALKARIFSDEIITQQLLDKLVELHRRALITIEDLTFDAAINLDDLLAGVRASDLDTADNIKVLFSELYLTSLNLTNLALDVESVIELTFGQQLGGIQALPVGTDLVVRTKIERIVGLLSQLSPGPRRVTLARIIGEIEDLLYRPNGLINRLEAQRGVSRELAGIREARDDISDAFASFTRSINDEALQNVKSASLSLNTASFQMLVVLAAALGAIVLAVFIGNSVIIERQISRRMQTLNTAVHAIASGNLDHPINIGGPDEIGDISRDLTIFRQNALDLKRSNSDLEGFAYVAAHDLRSPLRAIHDLAEWTLEDPDNHLTTESLGFMSLLVTRTNRLSQLLTDLLNYARAGQTKDDKSTVDFKSMVSQLAQLLDKNGNFDIRYEGPQLVVRTYATPLQQILMNLISNSVKHHDQDKGTIIVTASLRKDRVMVKVTDDGPGIPKQYQEKVFALFQTLSSRDQVEGSGIGLAIIRKLITRYDGEVQLISDPSARRGTTFIFDLPGTRQQQSRAAAQ